MGCIIIKDSNLDSRAEGPLLYIGRWARQAVFFEDNNWGINKEKRVSHIIKCGVNPFLFDMMIYL